MKILVVGSGTAGLITALILKKRLNADIDIVHSDKIGIVGVGEGSTEHFAEFAKFMGYTSNEILKECGATFKSGIFFKNWNGNNTKYFHYVGYPYTNQYAQYSNVYGKIVSENNPNYYFKNLERNEICKDSLYENFPLNQFHFNTYKLNNFLMKKFVELGGSVFEDEILNIIFKENGEIDNLVGEKKSYDYDFYIDSTGFRKTLIGKMGSKWVSFGEYLKMKSAIVFPTEDEENYNIWTLSQAMKYGWMFKIPVWGRHGNGYIFDSDYISADQAKQELDVLFNKNVEISKTFNFDPGHLDKVWVNNCVAVGLSGSFVEPLEATSIGTSIQQAFMLMHKLPNYKKADIEKYNKAFNDIMNNIRDFICLHYIVKRSDTVFWKDVSQMKVPDSLQNNLECWKNKLPITDDFSGSSRYILFWQANFTVVMHGLDLFNREEIRKEYMSLNDYIIADADNHMKSIKNLEARSTFITHKNYIKTILDSY